LKYLGFGGRGYQVRDAMHPRDLARIVDFQLRSSGTGKLLNVSGGQSNSMSLRQLTEWCDARFGAHCVEEDGSDRPYDVPWMILDSGKAREATGWCPQIGLDRILEEIADHAAEHPDWLAWCGA
jgi:CDP-paratose 2-epimerase